MNAHPTTCLCCLSLDSLPDSIQIKNKCLKNECSHFFCFSFFSLFSGQQVCSGWKLSTTYHFGFLCKTCLWLLRAPLFFFKKKKKKSSLLLESKSVQRVYGFICLLRCWCLHCGSFNGSVTRKHNTIYLTLVQERFCAHL